MEYISRRDLDFLLFHWLNADAILTAPAFGDHDRESVTAILDLSQTLATDHFAPHYKAADQDEPVLVDGVVKTHPDMKPAIEAFRDAGFFAMSFPEEQGGLQLPYSITAAASAIFGAANVSTSGFAMLTGANARLISRYGTEAQKACFASKLVHGEWFGTMCLSEPGAGSSLADIKTRAVVEGDDELGVRYRIRGNKMWISSGDHDCADNIVHLVLAKIADDQGQVADGVEGISLFIVPKILPNGERNEVAVAGLNHKMGYHGLPNCLMNFGEGDGATGWLVGEAGQGLAIMFMMMNEARIAVGNGAAALAYRGYRQSVEYAQQRMQGRLSRDPSSPQVPIVEHLDVKRMLLAQKAYAEGALALCLWGASLVDQETIDGQPNQILSLLTPVIKAWPSEFGPKANDLAIQVHGGYGYTRDFDVEQLYRDNRLNPIHEGTNGIQALDLLLRKIMKDQGEAYRAFDRLVEVLIARVEPESELSDFSAMLGDWRARMSAATLDIGRAGPEKAMAVAHPYQFAFSHYVMAFVWLSQADKALAQRSELPADFVTGKLATCRYFFEWELPQIAAALDLVASNNGLLRNIPDEAFA